MTPAKHFPPKNMSMMHIFFSSHTSDTKNPNEPVSARLACPSDHLSIQSHQTLDDVNNQRKNNFLCCCCCCCCVLVFVILRHNLFVKRSKDISRNIWQDMLFKDWIILYVKSPCFIPHGLMFIYRHPLVLPPYISDELFASPKHPVRSLRRIGLRVLELERRTRHMMSLTWNRTRSPSPPKKKSPNELQVPPKTGANKNSSLIQQQIRNSKLTHH